MRRLKRQSRPAASAAAELPETPDGVLQVCHPEWRGVRSSAYAFGDPVLESSDLGALVSQVDEMVASGVATVVIQGWPPNAKPFAEAASEHGISVLSVFHSSPAQHGVDGGEADAVDQMLRLQKSGVVDRIATDKAGIVEPFRTLSHDIAHVGNRVPDVGDVTPAEAVDGTNVGIFLHPMWRKNVTTQILAALHNGWRPHVMADPEVPYLAADDIVVHGEVSRSDFLAAQAGMDISFNVTLSECHPMMPMESYRLGVPCLISNTSDLFKEDSRLTELTSVNEADNPSAIASAAARLLSNKDEAVALAGEALDTLDARSAEEWRAFTRR